MRFSTIAVISYRGIRGVQPQQVRPAVEPTGEATVMQTLPAYLAHLGSTYAAKTVKTYGGDVR